MKKIIVVLFTLLLVLGLTACGSKDEPDSAEANPLDAALIAKGKIIVGTSPDYPPFESLNTSGEVEGFEVDLLNAVIDILNEQNGTSYELDLKQMGFDTIISALQASQIDVGMSGFTYSPERDCIFTTPHNVSKQVIITREDTGIKSAADLINSDGTVKKVAAGTGTTGDMAIGEVIGPENVQHNGDYTIEFQALQAGQLDAVVCDEAVGDNYVKEMGLVKCEEPLVDEEMSFIIKTGNTALEAAFNKAVEAFIVTPEYTALLEKYELN